VKLHEYFRFPEIVTEYRNSKETVEQIVRTRRLATANRSRVSIRVTKNFGQDTGVVDHVKIFLRYGLIIQTVVAISRAMLEYAKFSDAGSLRSHLVGGADHLEHVPHTCVMVPNVIALRQTV